MTGYSKVSIDFDVSVGDERVRSIAGGCAIDGYDYLMVSDPTGEARKFEFDFSRLKKTVSATSVLNFVIVLTDIDGHVQEWRFASDYAVEGGMARVSNPRISQRRDGSGLVDVRYDYSSPREIDPATVVVAMSADGGGTWGVQVTSMRGDVGVGVPVGANRMATWDPSIDSPSDDPFPLSAIVVESSSFGDGVVGQAVTGTIMVSPADASVPRLSVSTGTGSPRRAVRSGNVCKVEPTAFAPIESSSQSSQSSESSSASSQSTSSASSHSSSSSSSSSSQSSSSSSQSSASSPSTQTTVSSA